MFLSRTSRLFAASPSGFRKGKPGDGGGRQHIAGPADAVQNARRSAARGTARALRRPLTDESTRANAHNRAKGHSPMNLQEILENAYEAARKKAHEEEAGDCNKDEGRRNSNRSSMWVEALGCELYRNEKMKDLTVLFTKGKYNNDFKINEFLYDILIAKTGESKSKDKKITLKYVKEAVWQVESEFSENSRESVVDFSKLVIGKAQHKLFIGPYIKKSNELLQDVLKKPARAAAVSGNCYLGLIPHPRDWCNKECESDVVECWTFDRYEDCWKRYSP